MQGFSEPTSEICPFILVNHDQTKKSHHLTRTPTNFAQFWFSTSCTGRAFGCTLYASLSGASGECPMASPAHAVRGSRPPTDVERLRVEGHAVPELFRFLGGFLNHVKTWGLPAVRFLEALAFQLLDWFCAWGFRISRNTQFVTFRGDLTTDSPEKEVASLDSTS